MKTLAEMLHDRAVTEQLWRRYVVLRRLHAQGLATASEVALAWWDYLMSIEGQP